MKPLIYRVVLKTDATFGSGEAILNEVHSEVELDSNGFPFMKGKTLKGNLRQVMRDLNLCSNEKLDKYFGTEGLIEKSNLGQVFFDDLVTSTKLQESLNVIFKGSVPEMYREHTVEKYYRLHNIVKEAFTAKRQSIEVENGLAEEKSLRTERVIQAGLPFYTAVHFGDEIKDEDVANIKLGFKALTQLGSKKNKGRGQVRFELLEKDNDNGEEAKEEEAKEEEAKEEEAKEEKAKEEEVKEEEVKEEELKGKHILKKRFRYQLINEQNLKLSKSFNGYDFEEAKDFIPGSVIRGAVISELAREKTLEETQKETQIKAILEECVFSNAYINGFDPIPLCFYGDKKKEREMSQKLKSEKRTNYDFEKFINSVVDEKANLEKLTLTSGYCLLDEKECLLSNPKLSQAMHHATAKEENLFRYEYLEKGQIFEGEISITVNDEILKKIEEILSKPLYLGGSKSSGYGRCRLSFKEAKEKQDVSKTLATLPKELTHIIPIVCQSDCSVEGYHEMICELKEVMTDLNEENIIAFTGTEYVSGFNHNMGGMLPVEKYYKRGSTFFIKAKSKPTEEIINWLNRLSEKPFGKRTQDGFGMFKPCFELLKVKNIKKMDEDDLNQKTNDQLKELKSVALSFEYPFDERLQLEKRFINKMVTLFYDTYYDFLFTKHAGISRLSKAKLGELQGRILDAIREKKSFKQFCEALNEDYLKRHNESSIDEIQVRGEDIKRFVVLVNQLGIQKDWLLMDVISDSNAFMESLLEPFNDKLNQYKSLIDLDRLAYTQVFKALEFSKRN